MPVPTWLQLLDDWVIALSPMWTILILVFWKPMKILVINIYNRLVKSPVDETKEDIDEHDERLALLEQKIEKLDQDLEQRKRISRALLHHEIFQTAKQALKNKSITEIELENLEELYIPYKEIGGNGTAEKLYEECRRLPIQE